jgi:tRNA threonylcarbamoyladenosine biosynthesis protein TsaB
MTDAGNSSAGLAAPLHAKLLAFDTSTELLAVALHTPAGDWAEQVAGGAAASAALLPLVHSLLARAGIGLHDVHAIAFGCGPGAFTGLRTSCAVAQGLALGLGCPLLPVDSLLIVAEDARWQVAPEAEFFDVAVAMDARLQQVYAGRYAWRAAGPGGGFWQTRQAPALCSLAQIHSAWQVAAPAWLAGTAQAAFGAQLQVPDSATWVAPEQQRAAALLRLARAAHATGAAVDAAEALPLYLRDKVALTSDERAALRLAAGAAA